MCQTVKSIVSRHKPDHNQFVIKTLTNPVTNCFAAICKDSPNGGVAIEKSCTRYWLCVGGYPRLHRCPAGLAFNPNVGKCDLDYTVPGWFV